MAIDTFLQAGVQVAISTCLVPICGDRQSSMSFDLYFNGCVRNRFNRLFIIVYPTTCELLETSARIR